MARVYVQQKSAHSGTFGANVPLKLLPLLAPRAHTAAIARRWLMCANCHWESFDMRRRCSALLQKVIQHFSASHLISTAGPLLNTRLREAGPVLVPGRP